MESVLLGPPSSSFLQLPKLHLHDKPRPSNPPSTICCGLRKSSREPLWRRKVMSTEAIQAVQALKIAKSSQSRDPSSPSFPSSRLGEVFSNRIGRLIKGDLVAVLGELQRQNEWEIALQVFDFMRNEDTFRLDLSLYGDMILMLGKNKLIEIAEKLLSELKKEGLQPDTRIYNEMIGAYLKVGMIDKAMNTYKIMKDSGCNPDRLTLTILIRNLDKAGEEELASFVKKDCNHINKEP
ncbi:uncharacterized protein A4U43_C09F5840 [Asparagus officinalis]|uniref:Pentacotripeptide-repeat region of PRORP domain-containing protein n=1 Tax=Asparagus officinalis TaxID=4686 RepID=A0A5P1E5V8_ASPOF|nr:uncharacterized protein A4U43_C09F5840 [Asparagus officinalis]